MSSLKGLFLLLLLIHASLATNTCNCVCTCDTSHWRPGCSCDCTCPQDKNDPTTTTTPIPPTTTLEPTWSAPPLPPNWAEGSEEVETVTYGDDEKVKPTCVKSKGTKLENVTYNSNGERTSADGTVLKYNKEDFDERIAFNVWVDPDWNSATVHYDTLGRYKQPPSWRDEYYGRDEYKRQVSYREVKDPNTAEWKYNKWGEDRITNLNPNTTYEVSVRIEEQKVATWSEYVQFRTKKIRPWVPPKELEVFETSSHSTVAVKWSSAETSSISVDGYTIYYGMWDALKLKTSWSRKSVKGSERTTQVTVTPDRKYFFAIEARNEIGEGMLSGIYRFFT